MHSLQIVKKKKKLLLNNYWLLQFGNSGVILEKNNGQEVSFAHDKIHTSASLDKPIQPFNTASKLCSDPSLKG